MRRPSFVTRAFDGWVAQLDPELARELTSPRSWILTSLFVVLLVAASTWVPGVREHLTLRPIPALITFAPAAISAAAFSAWHWRRKAFSRGSWLAILLGTIYVQFFCASLVAWTGVRARGTASSIFLIAAVYHGHSYRVTLSRPFLPIGTILAASAAMALNPTPERISALCVMGVAAVVLQLIAGSVAARLDVVRRRSERLSAAVRAQVLNDQQVELNRLSETLSDVLGRNHDLRNSTMAIQLTAEQLRWEFEGSNDRDVVLRLLMDLDAALERVKALAADAAKNAQKQRALDREEVDVAEIVADVARAVQARFPIVELVTVIEPGAKLAVFLREGAVTLRRIVENLVLNSCEGDGRSAARRVEIKVNRDESGGRVRIAVSDDGPGFAPQQLSAPIQAFATAKRSGTGLGLYTSERLLRANGGSLSRVNRPDGGACVTVLLPL